MVGRSLPAPCLDGPGKRGDNETASFNAVRLLGCIEVKTGAGVDALTPVALSERLTTAHPCAAKLQGWVFLLLPRASVSADVGANLGLIFITMPEILYLLGHVCQYLLGACIDIFLTSKYFVRMDEKEIKSELFAELSKLGASKGGRARANILTGEERSEIARKAVQARWAKKKGPLPVSIEQVSRDLVKPPKKGVMTNPEGLPIALFRGTLPIGAAKFPVYVLDNGKRVMAQREVVRALTGQGHGDISRYIQSASLREFIDSEAILTKAIRFVISGTQFTGNGFEATLLLDICDAYLRAREAGRLSLDEQVIAKQAEIITRACAKVGIIALIDEATGYEAFKKKRDLQLKLQAFISEDLQEWARMFPDEFWFELARLEGIHYSARSRPLRWGKYVMAFVYDAVDGDIGKKLREINPDPHFQQNHHQWLKDFGRQKVHDQIERVVTIMKLCDDMDDFRAKFARVFKKTSIATQMSFNWDQP
jgi:hypothetical protein